MGVPQIIHFNRSFQLLGHPHLWKPPYIYIIQQNKMDGLTPLCDLWFESIDQLVTLFGGISPWRSSCQHSVPRSPSHRSSIPTSGQRYNHAHSLMDMTYPCSQNSWKRKSRNPIFHPKIGKNPWFPEAFCGTLPSPKHMGTAACFRIKTDHFFTSLPNSCSMKRYGHLTRRRSVCSVGNANDRLFRVAMGTCKWYPLVI